MILSLAAFVVYLVTAAPFNLFLDAPRFVSAIVTLGVGNPPEPLYIMLAKLFTYLPFGSYIFRIQVFSALTAAVTLIFAYKLTLKLIEDTSNGVILKSKDGKLKQTLAGVFALLSLAFSYQFWSQAQNVENFILVLLIEAIILWLVFKANSQKSVFIGLCLIAVIFGLATGTNPVIASVIPAILIMMWYRRKYVSFEQWIVWVAIGTVAVVAVHLYIPIRAAANPFLNYWRATDFESVWNLSTGAGLNVYVPELGRINGFTGSPEVFFKSSFNYFKHLFLTFAVIILPFIVLGGWYLWRKSKYYFYLLVSILIANFIFSGFYFSGNQESWFLISDSVFVILAGAGFYYLTTEPEKIFMGKVKIPKGYHHYSRYILIVALLPLIVWFGTLNRVKLNITGDYIDNLYRPIGSEKAILFGSSDLFDSASFYVHDVPGSHYKPNVVPVTDNMFYIFEWYRKNLSDAGLKMPDGSKLKYNSAEEYSRFVEDLFEKNMNTHKIYVTIPAMRNNFLLVYGGDDQGGSLKLDEKKFKLIPQGMVYQVVSIDDQDTEPKLENFDYTFKTPNFPYQKPLMLERVYNTEVTGLTNEYAYSLVAAGDYFLKQNTETDKVLEFYQRAYEFSPNNVETISRVGNYFGQAVGDHAKAAEFFEKALKLEPRNVSLLFNLSLAYENSGKIDKAIATLNKVLQSSKGNSQMTQLAKGRLEALKNASPSAGASGSGTLQLSPGSSVYTNAQMNLQFAYPKGFKVTERGDTVGVTNGFKGKDELTIDFSAHKLAESDNIEKLLELTPLKTEGVPLGSQPITISGFQAVGKTIGSGEHITFVILMKRNDQGFVLKVYPGDSNKNADFSQILGTVKTLK